MAVSELHIAIDNHMAVYVLQSHEQPVSCVYVMSKQTSMFCGSELLFVPYV